MEFTIEFYETVTGRCPVREFLDELKASNPDDFAAVMAGLAKLRNNAYHKPPLSKSIGDDLFELRYVGIPLALPAATVGVSTKRIGFI